MFLKSGALLSCEVFDANMEETHIVCRFAHHKDDTPTKPFGSGFRAIPAATFPRDLCRFVHTIMFCSCSFCFDDAAHRRVHGLRIAQTGRAQHAEMFLADVICKWRAGGALPLRVVRLSIPFARVVLDRWSCVHSVEVSHHTHRTRWLIATQPPAKRLRMWSRERAAQTHADRQSLGGRYKMRRRPSQMVLDHIIVHWLGASE